MASSWPTAPGKPARSPQARPRHTSRLPATTQTAASTRALATAKAAKHHVMGCQAHAQLPPHLARVGACVRTESCLGRPKTTCGRGSALSSPRCSSLAWWRQRRCRRQTGNAVVPGQERVRMHAVRPVCLPAREPAARPDLHQLELGSPRWCLVPEPDHGHVRGCVCRSGHMELDVERLRYWRPVPTARLQRSR